MAQQRAAPDDGNWLRSALACFIEITGDIVQDKVPIFTRHGHEFSDGLYAIVRHPLMLCDNVWPLLGRSSGVRRLALR